MERLPGRRPTSGHGSGQDGCLGGEDRCRADFELAGGDSAASPTTWSHLVDLTAKPQPRLAGGGVGPWLNCSEPTASASEKRRRSLSGQCGQMPSCPGVGCDRGVAFAARWTLRVVGKTLVPLAPQSHSASIRLARRRGAVQYLRQLKSNLPLRLACGLNDWQNDLGRGVSPAAASAAGWRQGSVGAVVMVAHHPRTHTRGAGAVSVPRGRAIISATMWLTLPAMREAALHPGRETHIQIDHIKSLLLDDPRGCRHHRWFGTADLRRLGGVLPPSCTTSAARRRSCGTTVAASMRSVPTKPDPERVINRRAQMSAASSGTSCQPNHS